MLSCTVENRAKDLLQLNPKWMPAVAAADNQALLQSILAYLDSQKELDLLNNDGIPRMVRGYFYEMACVIFESARVLKSGAPLIMVNDNVRYAGASISVDIILSEIAEQLGFEVEQILVLPNGKGNSSQQMGAHGRDALRKCVYLWRKNLAMPKPYQQHLKSSKSLETTYEAVRAGFVALALEKNRRATPFVAQARALKAAASKAKTPADLMKIAEIQTALLTAAGVSDKATNHLQDSDKREAVSGLIKNFLEPAGVNFVEELVFRFLLTRGDTLGGSMRNIGGFMAQKKLTRAILACLKLAGQKCHWLHADTQDMGRTAGG